MALPHLKNLLKTAIKKDLFWVALGDEVMDHPRHFEEVKNLAAKYPDWEISIMPQEQVENETMQWTLVTPEFIQVAEFGPRPAGPITRMRTEINALRADLEAAKRIAEILREYVELDENFHAREAQIKEREAYLQASEESLMQKAQELEELRTELEHRDESHLDRRMVKSA